MSVASRGRILGLRGLEWSKGSGRPCVGQGASFVWREEVQALPKRLESLVEERKVLQEDFRRKKILKQLPIFEEFHRAALNNAPAQKHAADVEKRRWEQQVKDAMRVLGVVLTRENNATVALEAPTSLVLYEHLFAVLGALDYSIQSSRRVAIDKRFEQPAIAPELLSKGDMSILQARSKLQRHPRGRCFKPCAQRNSFRSFSSQNSFEYQGSTKGGKGKGKGYTQRFIPRKDKLDEYSTPCVVRRRHLVAAYSCTSALTT